MHSAFVSVIVPNFNHASHLKQRLDTVLNQTFRDFEVIILDDNSDDGSREIIEAYKSHPQISQICVNSVNSGNPFKQWERGLMLAKGNWVWIAESDDYASLDFLSTMIQATTSHINLGLVYCDSIIVDESGLAGETFAKMKNAKFRTSRWSSDYVNDGRREIFDYLLPGGTINNTSAVLFNREKLLLSNPFDLNLRYVGDKYAFTKVLSTSDVAYVSKPLNFFRNPFNKKHADRYQFYFYEQFLVFNWVLKNLEIPNRSAFFKAFYANTRNSLFRCWGVTKLKLYARLFRENRYLLMKSISRNLYEGGLSILLKMTHKVY